MAPKKYTGPLAVFWLIMLVGSALNLTALRLAIKHLLSKLGLCEAPTHREFLESLVRFLEPEIASRDEPPNPINADGSVEGCIVLCNHVNWADFVLDIAFIPKGVFVSRDLLWYVFFPASVIRDVLFADMVYFKRKKTVDAAAKAALYDTVAAKCKEGRSVVVYAEGTRNNTGEKMKLKVGLIKLAYERNIPLYVSMVSNKYGVVDEKNLTVTFGAKVANKMSPLVLPAKFDTFDAFLAATQAAWDDVWDKTR